MPNYLISSFAQLTNPTSGVEYLVLDPTDTSMAPTGTDKRITDANAIYSPSVVVVAPSGYSHRADYYTTGSNDDVQINAALVAAAGKKVVLMEGTYTLGNSILIPSNTILKGSGMWTTILKGGNNTSIAYLIKNTNSNTSDTNISIEDLQLDCNGTNQPSNFAANGTDLRFVTQFQIKNVWAKNAGFNDTTQAVGIGMDSSTKGTVINCISSNNTHYGYSLYKSYDITCVNCIAYSNGRHGFGGGGDSQATVDHDITFESCISFGDTQGFWLREINGLTINNCEVDGNSVVDTATTTAAGMIFAAVNNLSITNCRIHDIQGTNDGVRVDGPYLSQGETSRNMIISSNQFYNLAKNGVFMRSSGTQNAVITNNVFKIMTNGYGIINQNCNDTVISGNYIEKAGLSGMIISQSQRCAVANNICKNNGQLGNSSDKYGIYVWSGSISFQSTDNNFTGNHCYDDQGAPTQDTGIKESTSNADRNIYTANNLKGNKTTALSTTGANDVIANNIES